jgi:hypothetical protein
MLIYIYHSFVRFFVFGRGTEFKIIYSILDSDNRVTSIKGNKETNRLANKKTNIV